MSEQVGPEALSTKIFDATSTLKTKDLSKEDLSQMVLEMRKLQIRRDAKNRELLRRSMEQLKRTAGHSTGTKPLKRSQTIWGGSAELASQWGSIAHEFYDYFHLLAGGQLGTREFAVIVCLFRFKWDARDPFPSLKRIAKMLNRSTRYIREVFASLESHGLLVRVNDGSGGRNRYDLQPLFNELVRLKLQARAHAVVGVH